MYPEVAVSPVGLPRSSYTGRSIVAIAIGTSITESARIKVKVAVVPPWALIQVVA